MANHGNRGRTASSGEFIEETEYNMHCPGIMGTETIAAQALFSNKETTFRAWAMAHRDNTGIESAD
jgi:hypothetical protein